MPPRRHLGHTAFGGANAGVFLDPPLGVAPCVSDEVPRRRGGRRGDRLERRPAIPRGGSSPGARTCSSTLARASTAALMLGFGAGANNDLGYVQRAVDPGRARLDPRRAT